MKAAHTPGPWAIRPNSGTAVNAGKKHIAMVNFFKTHDDAESVYGEEHDANARLIAVSPDLLALLVESQTSIGGDWRERRDAAIAKATGDAP